ncbi:MAG: hypothetical protein HPY81_10040 [Firmicutes bacterium]|nr:hypothetical protein [Bacillota bacterium]
MQNPKNLPDLPAAVCLPLQQAGVVFRLPRKRKAGFVGSKAAKTPREEEAENLGDDEVKPRNTQKRPFVY